MPKTKWRNKKGFLLFLENKAKMERLRYMIGFYSPKSLSLIDGASAAMATLSNYRTERSRRTCRKYGQQKATALSAPRYLVRKISGREI